MSENKNNTNELLTGKERRESSPRTSFWLLILCFVLYSCGYIARVNYSTASESMINLGLLDDNTAGLVSAIYFICYASGQVVSGMLADRKSPFVLIGAGLSIIIASNIAMFTLYSSPVLLILWWAINGIGQSLLWAPVFYIITNILSPEIRMKALTLVSVCTPAGKISGYLLAGASLDITGSWKGVFGTASVVIAAVLIAWIAYVLPTYKTYVLPERPKKVREKSAKQKSSTKAFAIFASSGMLFMVPVLIVHGLFLNGAGEVIPRMLIENFGVSASVSAYLNMIIPAVGTAGIFLCNWLYFKVFKKHEMKTSCISMCLSALPIIPLVFLCINPGTVFGKEAESAIFVTMYGLMYVFQLSFSHAVISLCSVRFSKHNLAATVSGVGNAINYAGSAISTYGMSLAVGSMPVWLVMLVWVALLVIAGIFTMMAIPKWTKFIANDDEQEVVAKEENLSENNA